MLRSTLALLMLQPFAGTELAPPARIEGSEKQAAALLRYSVAAERDAAGEVTLTVTVLRDRAVGIGGDPGFFREARLRGGGTVEARAERPQYRGCDARKLCWYAQRITLPLGAADLAAFSNGAGVSFEIAWSKGPPDLLSVPMAEIGEVQRRLSEAE